MAVCVVQTDIMRGLLIGIIAVALLGVGAAILQSSFDFPVAPEQKITSFEECVAAGNPVMESYPRQCSTQDGKHFVEDISDDARQVPEPPQGQIVGPGCAVAGCSGQLCVSEDEAGDIMTTCEFRPEYACFDNATCEVQANGECGWTETPELRACLKNAAANDQQDTPDTPTGVNVVQ